MTRAPVKLNRAARNERGAEIRRRVEAGEKVVALAHEYGIHETSIYYWSRGLNAKHEEKRFTRPVNSVFALGSFQGAAA